MKRSYGTSTAHPLSLPGVKGVSSPRSLQRCTTISSLSATMPIEPHPIYHGAHHSSPNHTITKVTHLTATVTPCLTSHTTHPSKPPPQPSFTRCLAPHQYLSSARPTLCTPHHTTHTPKPQQQHPSTRHSPPTQVNLTAKPTLCILFHHTPHPPKPPPQPSSPHLPSHPNHPSTPPPTNTLSAVRYPCPFPSTSPASAGDKTSSCSSPLPPLPHPLTQRT